MGNRDSSCNGSKADATRRRLLKTVAGGGTIALAGCLGGDDSDDTDGSGNTDTDSGDGNADGDGNGDTDGGDMNTDTATSGPSVADVAFVTAGTPDSGESDDNYNIYSSNSSFGINRKTGYMFDPLVRYLWQSGEYVNLMLSEMSFDGQSMNLTIRDDYFWHNGDPVTAEDVAAKYKLNRYFLDATRDDGHPFIESVSETGEHSISIDLKGEFNDEFMKLRLVAGMGGGNIRRPVWTKASVVQQWLDKFADAEGDDEEMGSVATGLQEAKFEQPLGNGPFQLENTSEQGYKLTKFEDYPYADRIDFTRWQKNNFGDEQRLAQARQGGDVSGAQSVTIDDQSVLPDTTEQISDNVAAYKGVDLLFNFEDSALQDDRVRRAVAHIVDFDQIDTNTAGGTTVVNQLTGVAEDSARNLLGDTLDSFERYGTDGTDPDMAASLLEDAGYTEDGGEWMDSDGNQLELPILSFDSVADTTKTVSQNLSQFGINAPLTTKGFSAFFSDIQQGNYTITQWYWGNVSPYVTLGGFFDGAGDVTGYASTPATYSVPPVGEPDGEPSEVNVFDIYNEYLTADEERGREILRTLLWVQNQRMPTLPLTITKDSAFLYRSDRWSIDTDNEAKLSVTEAFPLLVKTGDLSYSG